MRRTSKLRRIAAPLYATREASLIYEKAKVYYDGSHHIAIPHTTRWLKPRRKFKEKEIIVGEDGKPAEDKLEPSVLEPIKTPTKPASKPSF